MWNRLQSAGNHIQDGEVKKAETIDVYKHTTPLETINLLLLPQDIF